MQDVIGVYYGCKNSKISGAYTFGSVKLLSDSFGNYKYKSGFGGKHTYREKCVFTN